MASAQDLPQSDDIDEALIEAELEREGATAPGPFGVGHMATRAPRLQPALRVMDEPADEGHVEGDDVQAVNENSVAASESREHKAAWNARRRRAKLRRTLRKGMRIFLQLALIVCICLAGERIADILPFDMPSNICSMIVLLIFLCSGVLKMECIAEGADFLLDHMAIFFIPASVAIMGSFDLIANNVLKLVLICLITTVLVFFVTSFTVSTVMNLMLRREEQSVSEIAGKVAAVAGADATATEKKGR